MDGRAGPERRARRLGDESSDDGVEEEDVEAAAEEEPTADPLTAKQVQEVWGAVEDLKSHSTNKELVVHGVTVQWKRRSTGAYGAGDWYVFPPGLPRTNKNAIRSRPKFIEYFDRMTLAAGPSTSAFPVVAEPPKAGIAPAPAEPAARSPWPQWGWS